MCASGILLSKDFMVLWIGPSFALEATPILEILLMGAWINGIAFIPFSFLQGQGRPDVVAKVHFWEIIPYVFLLSFMLITFGVLGAAIAWCVRVAIDAVLLLKLAGFRARNMIGLMLGFILMLASYAVNFEFSDISVIWSVSLAGLVFVIFVGFAMTFDPNVRRTVTGIWHRSAT
jgi:O-antigen/teichoic acid export membrane protein